jgi:hypothetical protein
MPSDLIRGWTPVRRRKCDDAKKNRWGNGRVEASKPLARYGAMAGALARGL